MRGNGVYYITNKAIRDGKYLAPPKMLIFYIMSDRPDFLTEGVF